MISNTLWLRNIMIDPASSSNRLKYNKVHLHIRCLSFLYELGFKSEKYSLPIRTLVYISSTTKLIQLVRKIHEVNVLSRA